MAATRSYVTGAIAHREGGGKVEGGGGEVEDRRRRCGCEIAHRLAALFWFGLSRENGRGATCVQI